MQSEDISRGSQCRNYCRAVTTFCFSHIGLCSLVFGYCIMGAFTFKQLELKNEMKNRDDVERRRNNAADELLNFNKDLLVYHTSNWTQTVTRVLNKLESDLVHAMKIEGYDGIDGGEPQWSFSGALFYSIIVITTIGKLSLSRNDFKFLPSSPTRQVFTNWKYTGLSISCITIAFKSAMLNNDFVYI